MQQSGEFEKARERFKKDVQQRNRDNYYKLKEVNTEKAVRAAVELAYNDAKRTLTGIGNHTDKKKKVLKCIEDKLLCYFKNKAPSNEAEFDVIHNELCQIWCDEFKDSQEGKLGTYGKAQKIVNMSFKYLYCCEDAEKYRDHFKYCHMPLDSFTLEWFKRNTHDKITAGKIASWSNLENGANEFEMEGKKFYSYEYYKKKIREMAVNDGRGFSPLELEFIVWPQIQMELAAEGFLFGLEDNLTDGLKKNIKKMSLEDKYNKIVTLLKESGYQGKNDIH